MDVTIRGWDFFDENLNDATKCTGRLKIIRPFYSIAMSPDYEDYADWDDDLTIMKGLEQLAPSLIALKELQIISKRDGMCKEKKVE